MFGCTESNENIANINNRTFYVQLKQFLKQKQQRLKQRKNNVLKQKQQRNNNNNSSAHF